MVEVPDGVARSARPRQDRTLLDDFISFKTDNRRELIVTRNIGDVTGGQGKEEDWL